MQAILSLVLDRKALKRPLLEVVDLATRAGVDWIQIRDRELETLDLLRHAREVLDCARAAAKASGRSVEVFVNRRIDIALAAGADGVHLGADAFCAETARALAGEQRRIGVSIHSARSAQQVAAEAKGAANYLQLAPIFAPLSKPPDKPVLGLEVLAQATRHALPVLAQGGVDADKCDAILAAGAAGIAVTGAITLSDDPGAATARLRAALDAGYAARRR